MPTNYSVTAISEPANEARFSKSHADQQLAEPENLSPVLAKEPDRQTSSRRGAISSRGRSTTEEEGESQSQTRGRSASRANSRRSTQPRRATERGQAARRSAGPEARTGRQKKSRRGFAAMSPEQQREIARKGGLTVSRNRRHMADIGRVGGEHSHGGRRARR